MEQNESVKLLADKLQSLIGNKYEEFRSAKFSYDDATDTYHFNCGSIWYVANSVAELFQKFKDGDDRY
jgi:hypothetical protein